MRFSLMAVVIFAILAARVDAADAQFPGTISESQFMHPSGPGGGYDLFKTFSITGNTFISFFNEGNVTALVNNADNAHVWIIVHTVNSVINSTDFSIPGVACNGRSKCTSLIGLSDQLNGSIVALARVFTSAPSQPISYSFYIVWFSATDGSYQHSAQIDLPAGNAYTAVQQAMDGGVITIGFGDSNSSVWIRKYSSDGTTKIFDRKFHKGEDTITLTGNQVKSSFKQIYYGAGDDKGTFSGRTTPSFVDSTTLVFFINCTDTSVGARPPQKQTQPQSQILRLALDTSSGLLTSAVSYRVTGPVDVDEYYLMTSLLHMTSGDTFMFGNVSGTGQPQLVGDNQGFWVWKVAADGSVSWFCQYLLNGYKGGYALIPTGAIEAIGGVVYVAFGVTRANEGNSTSSWHAKDSMIASIQIGDPNGLVNWNTLLQNGYDVARCCANEPGDLRESIPGDLFVNQSGDLILPATTFNQRPIESVGSRYVTGQPSLYSGLDIWDVPLNGSSGSKSTLGAYSTFAPEVLQENMIPEN